MSDLKFLGGAGLLLIFILVISSLTSCYQNYLKTQTTFIENGYQQVVEDDHVVWKKVE